MWFLERLGELPEETLRVCLEFLRRETRAGQVGVGAPLAELAESAGLNQGRCALALHDLARAKIVEPLGENVWRLRLLQPPAPDDG